jgi:hypothetical protein
MRTAIRVLPNGLSERLEHRVIRVLDDRGIRSQATQGVVFDPAEAYVEVRRARVRRADGGIEEMGDASVVALTDAGYRMFYDQRQQRVTFNGLRVGDTLEVAFVRRDTAARNKFDDYFGEIVPLEDVLPQHRREYILEAPAPAASCSSTSRSRPSPASSPAPRSTSWSSASARASAPRPTCPAGPRSRSTSTSAPSPTGTRSAAGTGASCKRPADRRRQDPRRRQRGAAGAAEGADERAKVRALYKHVITSTRYVGLEFGIHGFKPYRTTDVYDRRFGDCKDKASLLKVMLGGGRHPEPPRARAHPRSGHHRRHPGLAVRVQPRDHLRAEPRPLPRRHRRVLRPRGAAHRRSGRDRPDRPRRRRRRAAHDPTSKPGDNSQTIRQRSCSPATAARRSPTT